MLRTIASLLSRGVGRCGVCIGSILQGVVTPSGRAVAPGHATPRCSSDHAGTIPSPGALRPLPGGGASRTA
jgi:hypothetical protein